MLEPSDEDSLHLLEGSVYVSQLDLHVGYCQVEVNADRKEKSAIMVETLCFFKFTRCQLAHAVHQ